MRRITGHTQQTGQIKHLPVKLVLATLLMFGFGFALVPLYDVFCDITGINGKGFERQPLTSNQQGMPQQGESQEVATLEKIEATGTNNRANTEAQIDAEAQSIELPGRNIRVQFIAQPQTGFTGDFYPQTVQLEAHLNQTLTTAYIARNATEHPLLLQAIPSISPSEAAPYVTKMECFCFQQQTLTAGQQREMGLTFSISKDLPEHIHKVTFSYALYPMIDETNNEQANATSDDTDANDLMPGGNRHEPNI